MLRAGRYRVLRRMDGRIWQGFAEVSAEGGGVSVREVGHWQHDGDFLESSQDWWLGSTLLRMKTPDGRSHDYLMHGLQGRYKCGKDLYGVELAEAPHGMKMRHWVAGPRKDWQQVVEYTRSDEENV